MPKFNTNTFYINPNNSRVVMQQDTGIIIPSRHNNYYVYNVGKTTVNVAVKSGNKVIWMKTLQTKTLAPGEGNVFDISDTKCVISGVHITNTDDKNGFVHCSEETGYPFYDDSDFSVSMEIGLISKLLVTIGVGTVPKSGDDLLESFYIFWPQDRESVWVKISSIVLHLLDKKTEETVRSILLDVISKFENKIKAVAQELHDNVTDVHALGRYLVIANDLIDLEKKFVFTEKDSDDYININFLLLPFYSAVINLKLKYYQYGITTLSKTQLDSTNIDRLRSYINNLILDPNTGAIAYVEKTRQDKLDHEYKTVYAELLFDQLVIVRTFSSLTGLEYFPLWRAITVEPECAEEPYNDVITFSKYYGRPTPLLARQMVRDDHPAPLQPPVVNGKRLQPQVVEVFVLVDELEDPKISGINVIYNDGSSALTGNKSEYVRAVDFQGSHLVKLTVHGWGQVDALEFTFCDDRSVKVGTASDDRHTFELQNHHIVGFFVANDFPKLQGQAANICLAYQLCSYEQEHSAQDKCSILR